MSWKVVFRESLGAHWVLGAPRLEDSPSFMLGNPIRGFNDLVLLSVISPKMWSSCTYAQPVNMQISYYLSGKDKIAVYCVFLHIYPFSTVDQNGSSKSEKELIFFGPFADSKLKHEGNYSFCAESFAQVCKPVWGLRLNSAASSREFPWNFTAPSVRSSGSQTPLRWEVQGEHTLSQHVLCSGSASMCMDGNMGMFGFANEALGPRNVTFIRPVARGSAARGTMHWNGCLLMQKWTRTWTFYHHNVNDRWFFANKLTEASGFLGKFFSSCLKRPHCICSHKLSLFRFHPGKFTTQRRDRNENLDFLFLFRKPSERTSEKLSLLCTLPNLKKRIRYLSSGRHGLETTRANMLHSASLNTHVDTSLDQNWKKIVQTRQVPR